MLCCKRATPSAFAPNRRSSATCVVMNDSIVWDIVGSEGDKIAVKFERDGKVQTVWVEPYKAHTRGWRRKSVRQLLISPAETPIIWLGVTSMY